jgi:hypothetical protein
MNDLSSAGATICLNHSSCLALKLATTWKCGATGVLHWVPTISDLDHRRFGNKEHLRVLSRQACTVVDGGRAKAQPHPLRPTAHPQTTVSDELNVRLCRVHHCEVRRRADEASWWTVI